MCLVGTLLRNHSKAVLSIEAQGTLVDCHGVHKEVVHTFMSAKPP